MPGGKSSQNVVQQLEEVKKKLNLLGKKYNLFLDKILQKLIAPSLQITKACMKQPKRGCKIYGGKAEKPSKSGGKPEKGKKNL